MAGMVVTCTLTLSRTKICYEDTAPGGQSYKDGEDIDQDDLLKDTLSWLASRVEAEREKYTEREARLLGRHLYEAIFIGAARTRFEECLKLARDEDVRLRLELIFGKDTEEFARLPWEFLYPNRRDFRDGFLAEKVDKFTLTRFIDRPLTKAPDLVDRPVKLLLAVCTEDSSPDDFRIAEIEELSKLLDQAQARGDIDLHWLANPTFEQLERAVRGDALGPDCVTLLSADPWVPDVVHIIGEGQPGAIVLQREAGAVNSDIAAAKMAQLRNRETAAVQKAKPVEAARVKELFAGKPPKLVILQTCYSDKVSDNLDSGALYTVAQSIVGAGVPAVLAMQYDIGRGVADKFAQLFYNELLEGSPIDVAVGKGRNRLLDPDVSKVSPLRAFGTPVIYLGHGGPLVNTRLGAAPDTKQKTAPDQTDSRRDCPRCHRSCQYQACPDCELRFYCDCGVPYENPLGRICGSCRRRIDQPPWPAPSSSQQPSMESAREKSGLVLNPKVPDWQKIPDQDMNQKKPADNDRDSVVTLVT